MDPWGHSLVHNRVDSGVPLVSPRNMILTFYPWEDDGTYYIAYSSIENDYLADELIPKNEVLAFSHFGGVSLKPWYDDKSQIRGT